MESLLLLVVSLLSTILGFIVGSLWEKFKYYKKTGKKLQDI
jgi:hypothetical protein